MEKFHSTFSPRRTLLLPLLPTRFVTAAVVVVVLLDEILRS